MINNLRIKNHKSHRDTRLDFCDGVNVIIGDPSKGKSNILRSLYLLFFNRPRGFKYQSKFSDDPVEITAGIDGKKVTFWKDKDSAEYRLDEKVLKDFGLGVPDEIKSFLNVSELNIQKQLDKPFLLTDSAGEVAKVMNRITKVEELDKWQAGLTKKANRTKGDIKRIEGELTVTNKELKKYDNIDQVERIVQRVKKREELIEKKQDDLMDIEDALEELDEVNKFLETAYERKKAEGFIKKADKIQDKIHELNDENASAVEFIDQVDYLSVILKQHKSLTEIVYKLGIIEGEINSREEELEVVKNCIGLGLQLEVLDVKKDRVLDEYKVLLKKMGKCPICSSKIDKKKIEEIMTKL